MKEVLWELWELLITLIESSISMHFVCTFLDEDMHNKKGKQNWMFLTILLALLTTILNHAINGYEGIYMSFYFLLVFVYAVFVLHGSLLQKAMSSIIFLTVILIDSALISNLISNITASTLENIYIIPSWIRMLTMILVQSVNFYVFQLLEHIFHKKRIFLRKLEWILLLSIFSISIISIILIQTAVLHTDFSQTARYCLLAVDAAFVAINIIAIILSTTLSKYYAKSIENEHLKLQVQYQQQYADTVKQQEESVHILRHDIKATISTLYDYIQQKDYDSIKAYLNDYTEYLSQTASIIHTNHVYVNAILNTKLTYAKEKKIQCTCHSPKTLPDIPSKDICSLLGNLIDNAIEYSCSANITFPEICVDITTDDINIHICVKNKIASSVLSKNPKLKTTKAHSTHHGLGIPTIKEIANRYQGTTDFYEEGEWFVASVSLCMME